MVRPAWDDLGPQRGVGREHAMEANEMEPWTRDERSQAWPELERGHHEMGGPVVVRDFELKHDLTSRRALQPCVGKGGASEVATQVFECGALMGGATHVGRQAQALGADTAVWRVPRPLGGCPKNDLSPSARFGLPGARAPCGRCRPPRAGAPGPDRDRCRPGRSSPALQ